jgi:thioredoxin 1
MLSPIVDELAAEFEGRATIAKCNVDDCEEIAARFGVRNIPTVVFVKDGEVVDRTVGVVPKQDLVARVNLYL